MVWQRTAFEQWTKVGTHPGDSVAALRAAAFANVFAAVVAFGALLMAVLLGALRQPFAFVVLALIPAYLLPFVLLHPVAKNAARLYIILFQTLASFAFTLVLGSGSGSQLVGFFTVGMPIVLFASDARRFMAVGVAASLIAFFVPLWFPDIAVGILPKIVLEPTHAQLLRSAVALMTFAVILIELLYLRTRFERSERRLNECIDNTGQLLKIACHDMASPLAVLNTALDLREVELDGRPPDRAHLMLKRTSARIQGLLGVIRKLHAVEDARIDLKAVGLSAAVNAAVEAMEGSFEAKRIHLALEGLTNDLAVMGDWTIMTESILTNVLSNAVKFSPRGGAVRVVAAAASPGVMLTVVDQGIGMPPEAVRNVTTGTVLPSRPGTEGELGSGFGLTLVRAFMKKMGGHVTIESSAANPNCSEGAEGGTTVRLFFQGAQTSER